MSSKLGKLGTHPRQNRWKILPLTSGAHAYPWYRSSKRLSIIQHLQHNSICSPFVSGLQLPNPAPDIYADLEPPREELAKALDVAKKVTNELLFTGPTASPLDISQQKKKYPKEAWGGKKLKSNPMGGLF